MSGEIGLYEKYGFVKLGDYETIYGSVDQLFVQPIERANWDLELLSHLDKLHTTELGVVRIKRNLSLEIDDIVEWCKDKISSVHSITTRRGKNWYVGLAEQSKFSLYAGSIGKPILFLLSVKGAVPNNSKIAQHKTLHVLM